MKIAIIAPSEIPARRANTLQVMKMAQAMVVLGHQVRLVAPRTVATSTREKFFTPQPHALLTESPSWQELAHHYGLRRSFTVEWLFSYPSLHRYDFSWRAVRWARSWQAELVYTRLPQAATLASMLGMATILEVHDLPQGVFGPRLMRRFLKAKGAKRLVLITHALAADLSQRFGTNLCAPFTFVAPDGVDLERYEQLPEPTQARQLLLNQARSAPSSPLLRISPQRFTAGYTGHLYPGRGSQLLLELAGRLPHVAFLVVGGEPRDVSRFEAEIQSRQLDNLILTGFVPNAELPLYQAACDALLMPYEQKVEASSGGDISRYLSPMKLFEYLASQRPIVSSDLAVLQEVLNSQNAILIPVGDLDAWEQAIERLIKNPSLREQLSRQARQDAQRYTWDMRAKKMLEGLEISGRYLRSLGIVR